MFLYACAAGETGDQPLKRDLCFRSLQIYESHVPCDSLELVPVLVNLAAATAGDSPTRRDLLERALSIKEQHLGEAHPDLVRCFLIHAFFVLSISLFYQARLLAPLANAVGDCGEMQAFARC